MAILIKEINIKNKEFVVLSDEDKNHLESIYLQ
jgi:hypothetical protein